jgi:hypothetical protein
MQQRQPREDFGAGNLGPRCWEPVAVTHRRTNTVVLSLMLASHSIPAAQGEASEAEYSS